MDGKLTRRDAMVALSATAAAAAKHVDAFMANVNWDEVERRFERAAKALKALRG